MSFRCSLASQALKDYLVDVARSQPFIAEAHKSKEGTAIADPWVAETSGRCGTHASHSPLKQV